MTKMQKWKVWWMFCAGCSYASLGLYNLELFIILTLGLFSAWACYKNIKMSNKHE